MSHGARLCTLLVGVPTIVGLAAVACSSQSPTPVTVTIFAAAQSTPTAIVVHGDVVYWIDSGSDTIMAQADGGRDSRHARVRPVQSHRSRRRRHERLLGQLRAPVSAPMMTTTPLATVPAPPS